MMLAAMRHTSSRVSIFAADRRPDPTAVGDRAVILLLSRFPQVLEEERNHVSVEFLVERRPVEAFCVGADGGRYLGEVRRTRGEKVEMLGIGRDVKIGLHW